MPNPAHISPATHIEAPCTVDALSPPEPALYSIPRARHRAGGIGNTLAYELIARGAWTAVKLGGRTFVTADSLNRFIASLPRADIRTGQRKAA